MRFNGKKYKKIMQDKHLTNEDVCMKTGLCKTALEYILENGFASEDAMERLAAAAGERLGELAMCDISCSNKGKAIENCIEFIRDSERATVSFSQGRYITKIKKLSEEYPEECEIVAENQDGSVYAHIPVAWIRINPGMELTDEQKEYRAEIARRVFHNDNGACENS